MKEGSVKRRILFVDDEPNVLMGLRRMLRTMRHEWEIRSAKRGSEALKMLAREPFDVVVSDMLMPDMDGSYLLTQVKQYYPMTVRIVLSGHSDHEMIIKSVRLAHQYLSKPCDSETLISTISRSCSLRDLLSQESLKRVISQTESLPSLPSLYSKVMEELQSPDGSIQRIGQIIGKDLGMTAKILQMVNSSFFGLPRHISDPSHAVILLGFDTVRALVLTIGLFSKFGTAALSALHVEDIYRHSMKTGAIAKGIAKMEGMENELVDNAFLTGLLHDLGKLVLASNFPYTYREVFKISRHENFGFHEAEMEKLGANHAEVGAYLLGLWGLNDSIVEGVAYHHKPWNCASKIFSPLTAVYAANILEHHANAGADTESLQKKFDRNYLGRFGLDNRIHAWKKLFEQIECDDYHNE